MPTPEQVTAILNRALAPLRYSTAQYITESNPYLSDADRDAMRSVQAVGQEDAELATRLIQLIERLEGIPQVGTPDPLFAELNYLSFPYLLDVLIREKGKQTEAIEERGAAVEGNELAQALLAEVLQTHETQLKKLKDLRERKYKRDEPAEAKDEAGG